MKQLQLIVTIINSERKNKNNNYLKYINALIEFLQFENSDVIDHHHDMMKVKTWHANDARNSHNIDVWQFYQMFTILHNAHVISIELQNNTYYINNYIDWNTYNIIYDSDFFSQEMRAACDYKKQVKY